MAKDLPNCGRVRIARYVAEFIGAMFLILSIRLSASLSAILASLAIGTCLMVVIYQFGWISGGHFNPAVTIAVLIRDSKNSANGPGYLQAAFYILSQLSGGVIGGIMGNAIGGDYVCTSGPIVDTDTFELSQGFFGELFFTFLLTSVVLNTGTHQTGNQFYGISIGFSLFVAINCIGSITGCAINPAVWFGLNMAAIICDTSDDVDFGQIWLYWGAHIIAACISGFLFKFLFEPADKMLNDESNTQEIRRHMNQESEEATEMV